MTHDVLIVDDEADIRMLIGGILEDEGYSTRGVADAALALEAIRQRRPSLCILDVWLQGSSMDGLQLLDLIVAELMIHSAMQRHESRGLHYTLDYPQQLPEAKDTILAPPTYGD